MKKQNQKRALKDKERTIIDFIDKRGGYVTANEIKKTGISYVTIQKYLKRLEKEEIIINVYKGKSKQKKYSINYDKILGEKR